MAGRKDTYALGIASDELHSGVKRSRKRSRDQDLHHDDTRSDGGRLDRQSEQDDSSDDLGKQLSSAGEDEANKTTVDARSTGQSGVAGQECWA